MERSKFGRWFFGDRSKGGEVPAAAGTDQPTASAGVVPAGWYDEGNGLRYWDGSAWTAARAPVVDHEPLTKTILWAMSLASGIAGVLGWGVPVVAFYWPLGLGGAGLALAVATRTLRGPIPWFAAIALIASLIAIGIGVTGYSELEDTRNSLNLP